MHEDDFSHYATTAQVAALFGVDVSTVSRWVAMGHLQSSRFGTHRTAPLVFDCEHVQAFGQALAALAAERAA